MSSFLVFTLDNHSDALLRKEEEEVSSPSVLHLAEEADAILSAVAFRQREMKENQIKIKDKRTHKRRKGRDERLRLLHETGCK